MEISLEKFKTYIPTVTLEDSRLLVYLADAKRSVERDSISCSHHDFDELQKLYALALMQDDKVSGVKSGGGGGNTPEGIRSIGVAGINIGFAESSSSQTKTTRSGKTGYYIDYEILLKKIHGMGVRIV